MHPRPDSERALDGEDVRDDAAESSTGGAEEVRMCSACQPWVWKKCAIGREEVVNVGRSGAEGLPHGGGRRWMRMYSMVVDGEGCD